MSYIRHKSEESMEDYLESILVLSQKLPVVRSIDVATELGFSKPSVSVAMKNLRQKEYIEVSPEGFIYLTAAGKQLAEHVYERHTFISEWLIAKGIPEDIAVEDACKMEHDMSDMTFQALKAAMEHDS